MADEWLYIVYFGPMIAAAVLLGVLFLRWKTVARVPGSPNELYRSLAHHLRVRGHVVAEKPGILSVRLGDMAAAKVRLDPAGDGTAVRVQPDATPSGWAVILILVMFGTYVVTAVAAIVLIAVIYFRVAAFTSTELSTLGSRPPVPTSGPADLGSLLIDGLAEAHRIAQQANEALSSRHANGILLVIMGGLVIWTAFFFGGGVGIAVPLAVAAVEGFVAGGAFVFLSSWLLRRRIRPRLARVRTWQAVLEQQRSLEAGGVTGETGRSSFEVLADASREIPGWLDASRREGFLREPHGDVVPFILGYWGVMMLLIGVGWIATVEVAPLAALVGVSGAGVLTLAIHLHRRWRRGEGEEARRFLGAWTARFEELRARMETFLGGL